MPNWLKITAVTIVLVLAVPLWLAKHKRDMIRQDLEQSREALDKVNSFHFHYDGPNYLAGQPPLTKDVWVLCPDYRYEMTRVQGAQEQEDIYFQGAYYVKTPEKWVSVPRPKVATVEGCHTLTGTYGLGVPAGFDMMLSRSTIQVNNQGRSVAGDMCYDYTVTMPTSDVAKRPIVQTLCLNSDDHLPREARFHGWGADRDSVYVYDQWNKADQPTFPEGFNPADY